MTKANSAPPARPPRCAQLSTLGDAAPNSRFSTNDRCTALRARRVSAAGLTRCAPGRKGACALELQLAVQVAVSRQVHPQAAQQAEHGARRAHGVARAAHVAGHVAAHRGQRVQRHEAAAAQQRFRGGPQLVQRVRVHQQVHHAAVKQRRRHQTPQLAGGDARVDLGAAGASVRRCARVSATAHAAPWRPTKSTRRETAAARHMPPCW